MITPLVFMLVGYFQQTAIVFFSLSGCLCSWTILQAIVPLSAESDDNENVCTMYRRKIAECDIYVFAMVCPRLSELILFTCIIQWFVVVFFLFVHLCVLIFERKLVVSLHKMDGVRPERFELWKTLKCNWVLTCNSEYVSSSDMFWIQ